MTKRRRLHLSVSIVVLLLATVACISCEGLMPKTHREHTHFHTPDAHRAARAHLHGAAQPGGHGKLPASAQHPVANPPPAAAVPKSSSQATQSTKEEHSSVTRAVEQLMSVKPWAHIGPADLVHQDHSKPQQQHKESSHSAGSKDSSSSSSNPDSHSGRIGSHGKVAKGPQTAQANRLAAGALGPVLVQDILDSTTPKHGKHPANPYARAGKFTFTRVQQKAAETDDVDYDGDQHDEYGADSEGVSYDSSSDDSSTDDGSSSSDDGSSSGSSDDGSSSGSSHKDYHRSKHSSSTGKNSGTSKKSSSSGSKTRYHKQHKPGSSSYHDGAEYEKEEGEEEEGEEEMWGADNDNSHGDDKQYVSKGGSTSSSSKHRVQHPKQPTYFMHAHEHTVIHYPQGQQHQHKNKDKYADGSDKNGYDAADQTEDDEDAEGGADLDEFEAELDSDNDSSGGSSSGSSGGSSGSSSGGKPSTSKRYSRQHTYKKKNSKASRDPAATDSYDESEDESSHSSDEAVSDVPSYRYVKPSKKKSYKEEDEASEGSSEESSDDHSYMKPTKKKSYKEEDEASEGSSEESSNAHSYRYVKPSKKKVYKEEEPEIEEPGSEEGDGGDEYVGQSNKHYKKQKQKRKQQQQEEEETEKEEEEAAGGDDNNDDDGGYSSNDSYSDADTQDGYNQEDSTPSRHKRGQGSYKKRSKDSSQAYKQPKPGAGQQTGAIHQRIDVAEIDDMAETNPYRILMLMAWAEMMACKDMSDPFGYWPLAGVHGLGWTYNGQKPGKNGFCKHNSPSFAAWHRPYVWAFEQGLMKHAANVVEGLKTQELQEQYGDILPTIRLPYWDFTSSRVPRILRDKDVTVINNHGNYITVRNPLASFKYPKSPGGGVSGYTERSPKWVVGVNRGAGPWAKELASFVRSRDFGCTWNGPTRCPGNLEQIHNSIHSTLGSTEGELGKSEYASFDPLFWLLHSAVDRCVWLFQNNNHDNGGGWAEPDTYYPFSFEGNPEHVGEMGYTYRDPYALSTQRRRLLAASPDAAPHTIPGTDAGHHVGSPAAKAALQRALSQWSGGYSGFQWQVQFTQLKRYQHSKKPANVFVLLKGVADAPPLQSSHGKFNPDDMRARVDFCGSVEGFSDDVMMAEKSRPVSASVDVTDCLQRAGVKTAVEPKDAADASSGPRQAAVQLSQLQLYALAPDGTDMTKSFDFGHTGISWTRPVKTQRNAPAGAQSRNMVITTVGALQTDAQDVVFSQALGYL